DAIHRKSASPVGRVARQLHRRSRFDSLRQSAERVKAIVLCDSGGRGPPGPVGQIFIGAFVQFFAAGSRGAFWFPWAFDRYQIFRVTHLIFGSLAGTRVSLHSNSQPISARSFARTSANSSADIAPLRLALLFRQS